MSERVPSMLARLWGLAGGRPEDPSCDWNATFDPVGLILHAPPRRAEYWCTPMNTITFAGTGGDGVHYGLLSIDGAVTDFSPVVMTVPMSDTPNMIVGANLKEFLALGCRFGYFALEQLVYARDATIEELELGRYDPDASAAELALLAKLSREFALVPWQRPRARLDELKVGYLDKLVVQPLVPEHAS